MKDDFIFKFIKENNFFASKKLGQNFLISNSIKKRIVDNAKITINDFVLEIGPGFGALTEYIYLKTKKITLIEYDKRLYLYLKNKYPDIEIINNDILKVDLIEVLKSKKYEKFIVISNLPYSISSQIIFNLLKIKIIDYMIIMVQKEMADRLFASVGSKKYNGFSVIINLLTNVEKLFDVSSVNFYPAPKVNSTVLKIKPIKNIKFNVDELTRFLKICFSSKRKQLINNLKKYYDEEKIKLCFKKIDLNINIRPEKIEPKKFIEMMQVLNCDN